jgi:hypothetical protein
MANCRPISAERAWVLVSKPAAPSVQRNVNTVQKVKGLKFLKSHMGTYEAHV